jgi:hypothetical protein
MNANACDCAKRLEYKNRRLELIRVLYEAKTISKNTTILAIFSELKQPQSIALNTKLNVLRPGLNFFCFCKIKGHPLVNIKISTDINLKLERIPSWCKHKETFRIKHNGHYKTCSEKNQVQSLTSLAYQTAYANGLTYKNFQKLIEKGELPSTLQKYQYKRYSHLSSMTTEQMFNMRFWFNNRSLFTCNYPSTHLGATFLETMQ